MISDIKKHLKEVSKEKPELSIDFLNEEIEAIREEFKVEKKELLAEIMDYKQYKKFVKNDLGYDPKEGSLKDFAENLTEKLEAKESTGNKELDDLRKESKKTARLLKELEENLAQEKEAKIALEKKNNYNTMFSRLTKGLQDLNNPDLHTKVLINDGEINLEDGELVWKNGNSFDKGLAEYLENNKNDLKSKQKAGGESNANADNKAVSSMDFHQMLTM